MGQLITVVEKPTARADVVRFDCNRSITGMSHERYRGADVAGERWVDELARRIFARGGVEGVHIYSNVVTVDLAPGATSEGLVDIIHELFLYYRPGQSAPATGATPATADAAATAAAPAPDPAATGS